MFANKSASLNLGGNCSNLFSNQSNHKENFYVYVRGTLRKKYIVDHFEKKAEMLRLPLLFQDKRSQLLYPRQYVLFRFNEVVKQIGQLSYETT